MLYVMYSMKRVLLLLLVALTCGCTSAPSPDAPRPEKLPLPKSGEFVSTAVTEDGKPRKLRTRGVRIHVYFDGPNVAFYAGCNRMGGKARFDGATFRVTKWMGTDIGCRAEDSWLGAFFGRGVRWQRTGRDLTLTSGDVVIELVDRRFAEPDRPLAGKWEVSSVLNPVENAAIALAPVPVHLNFDPEGRVDGNDGCANFTGRYEVRALKITFSGLRRDSARCTGPRRSAQRAVHSALKGTVEYWIEGKGLKLTAASDWGLQLVRAVPDEKKLEARWAVGSVRDGDTVLRIPKDVDAHLRFSGSGRVWGSTGCNRFRGSFAAHDHQVTVSDVTQTERACNGPAADVEAAVQQVLTGTSTFRIGWHPLTLTTESGRTLRLHWR